MTLLTKHKQQQQEMVKNLFRVSIGGKRTRTVVMIKSRQPKNGVKAHNSLGSTYAMLPFFFFFLALLLSPCSEIRMKRETERC